MDKRELTIHFDDAVNRGDEEEAIIYGVDLADAGGIVHSMLGFKRLHERNPRQYIDSSLLYVSMAYRLSRAWRNSDDPAGLLGPNLKETADAANIADMYNGAQFDQFWDFLRHEQMCWNIIASEHATEPEKTKYRNEAKRLMDSTVVRQNGDWIMEYLKFFAAHGF